MDTPKLIERDMTAEELARMNAGFDRHARDHGVEIQSSTRIGFVAMDEGRFIGCVSGLAYRNGEVFNGWFYLTDLFVERDERRKGLGARLLSTLESRIASLGIPNIWTWTASYEAHGFYRKQGYRVFTEFEGWYSDGSSRFGFRKTLSDPPTAH